MSGQALTLSIILQTYLTSFLNEAHITLVTVRESDYDTAEFRVFTRDGDKLKVTVEKLESI